MRRRKYSYNIICVHPFHRERFPKVDALLPRVHCRNFNVFNVLPATGLVKASQKQHRRLSKDYEKTTSSSEATLKIANIALLLRRLVLSGVKKKFHYRDNLQIP